MTRFHGAWAINWTDDDGDHSLELRTPLRSPRPAATVRTFSRDSLDFTNRNVVDTGTGIQELIADIRYVDISQTLVDMLIAGNRGKLLEVVPDVGDPKRGRLYRLIEPRDIRTLIDRDNFEEQQVTVRLRRTSVVRPAAPLSMISLPLDPDYWYSATDLLVNQNKSDGDAVTTWRNFVTENGNDLDSSDTNHTLVENGPGGRPYVDFPGTQSTDVFNHDSGGAFVSNNRHVVFVVARLDVASNMTLTNWSDIATGNIDFYDAFISEPGTEYRFNHKSVSLTQITGTTDPGTTNWHVYAYRISDGDLEVFIDSNSSEGGPTGIGSTLARTLLVGGRWTDTDTGSIVALDGKISEVLIYDETDSPARALNDQEIGQIMNTLKLEFGI